MSVLQVAIGVSNGTLYPVARSALLPGLPADVTDPETQFGVTVHRTPYGQPWVERPTGRVSGASGTVSIRVSGQTPQQCGQYADRWQRVLEDAKRIYVGARYLKVAALTGRPSSEKHQTLLSRTLKAPFEYVNDLWYLSDDDVRPTRFPVEGVIGVYPFGLLNIESEGTGFANVTPLGGVAFVPGSGLTVQLPGQSFMFNTIGLEVE